MVKPDRPHMAT